MEFHDTCNTAIIYEIVLKMGHHGLAVYIYLNSV